MTQDQSIAIRLLRESDIPVAMKLKEAAGWNQTEDDWRRLLQLEPEGCFAALLDGEVVGTTTSTTYGGELGWIGMVLVDPANRRVGVATTLLNTVLEYLREKVATIKLDATADGRHVYERLGFRVESLIERWLATPDSVSQYEGGREDFQDASRSDVLAVDRRAFAADRSKLLASLIDQALVEPVFARSSDGKLKGYALTRTGSAANYIGPVVANDEVDAGKLLDGTLSRITAQPVFIDLNTEFLNGRQLLLDRGFEKQRDLFRMSLGEKSEKTSLFVFAIAGPEVG